MAKLQLFWEIKISHRIFYQKPSGFLLRPRNCMLLIEIHSEHSHLLRTECCARKTDIQQSIRVYCMAFSYGPPHGTGRAILEILWMQLHSVRTKHFFEKLFAHRVRQNFAIFVNYLHRRSVIYFLTGSKNIYSLESCDFSKFGNFCSASSCEFSFYRKSNGNRDRKE